MSLPARLKLSPLQWFVLALVTVLVAVALSVFLLLRSVYQPIPNLAGTQVLNVPAGSNLTRVASQLHEQGWLGSPLALRVVARWQGTANAIQTGEYRLVPGMSAADLLSAMVNGDTIQYRITFVEGWTLDQVLTALRQAEPVEHTLPAEAGPEAIANAMQVPQTNPEGLVFPDTYFYTRGTSDVELLRRGYARLMNVLNAAWEQRLGALPYNSPYEALIMASIIEKESAASSERGHIAGVFVRRLEQGMRLQSDPTVIYGMGADFEGDIRRQDLTAESAYNTYRINGLPPTPIALAGSESIQAALHPLPSDYLYFVSRGDGSHYFSSTLEEHNAAVNRFQRQADNQQQ